MIKIIFNPVESLDSSTSWVWLDTCSAQMNQCNVELLLFVDYFMVNYCWKLDTASIGVNVKSYSVAFLSLCIIMRDKKCWWLYDLYAGWNVSCFKKWYNIKLFFLNYLSEGPVNNPISKN